MRKRSLDNRDIAENHVIKIVSLSPSQTLTLMGLRVQLK